jgi:hypothetical protein
MVRRLGTRGREPCEALHGPSRVAWHLVHLVHLVIWGARGCNLHLNLTEIPQKSPTVYDVSIDMPQSLMRSRERRTSDWPHLHAELECSQGEDRNVKPLTLDPKHTSQVYRARNCESSIGYIV